MSHWFLMAPSNASLSQVCDMRDGDKPDMNEILGISTRSAGIQHERRDCAPLNVLFDRRIALRLGCLELEYLREGLDTTLLVIIRLAYRKHRGILRLHVKVEVHPVVARPMKMDWHRSCCLLLAMDVAHRSRLLVVSEAHLLASHSGHAGARFSCVTPPRRPMQG